MDVTKTKQNFYKLTKNFVNKGLIFNAKLTNTKISFRFYVKKFKQTDFNKNKRNRNPVNQAEHPPMNDYFCCQQLIF